MQCAHCGQSFADHITLRIHTLDENGVGYQEHEFGVCQSCSDLDGGYAPVEEDE